MGLVPILNKADSFVLNKRLSHWCFPSGILKLLDLSTFELISRLLIVILYVGFGSDFDLDFEFAVFNENLKCFGPLISFFFSFRS